MAGAVGNDDVLRLDLEPFEELVLVADELAQPQIPLRRAIGERLRALGLHHPRRHLHDAVVGKGGRVGEAAPKIVLRVLHRPGRRQRGAHADLGARGQELLEGGAVLAGHGGSSVSGGPSRHYAMTGNLRPTATARYTGHSLGRVRGRTKTQMRPTRRRDGGTGRREGLKKL